MKKFEKGEALLAEDLNAMVVELEDLQGAPRGGGLTQRGHAVYGHAWHTSELQAAGVVRGIMTSADVTEPQINDGVIELPAAGGCDCAPAEYNPTAGTSTLGLVRSVQVDTAATAGYISNGNVFLPQAHQTEGAFVLGVLGKVEQYHASSELPEPGVNGWIQTLWLPMQSANGGSQIVSYRQLMRIYHGALQVSMQWCLHPGGDWEEQFGT